MSEKETSVIDYFNQYGDLNEEASEFLQVELKQYIDKRTALKPSYIGKRSGSMHFDLEDGTEVSFYLHPNIVYADILYSGGIRTIAFKCRQKKNLTRFISRVLELAQKGPSIIHPDFRA